MDGREPVDPFVVGISFIVGGDEAFDLGDPEVPERLDPEMPVEQEIATRMIRVGDNGGLLDQSDGADRSKDLSVLLTFLYAGSQDLEWHELCKGDDQAFALEGERDAPTRHAAFHRLASPSRRAASTRGMVASPSDLRIVAKLSSASRSFIASTMKRSRAWAKSAFRARSRCLSASR